MRIIGWIVLAVIVAFMFAVMIGTLWAQPAMHDHVAMQTTFYEPSCCSGRDCAPVADGVVSEKAAGVLVQGYGLLSYSDARLRWSRDDRDHVCAQAGKLLCIYRRPKAF